MRKERPSAFNTQTDPAAEVNHRWTGVPLSTRPHGVVGRGDEEGPREPYVDDLPAADDQPKPCLHRRLPTRRDTAATPGAFTEGGAYPLHPYTRALLSATPFPNPRATKHRMVLAGDVSSAIHLPQGCFFHPRCPQQTEVYREIYPTLKVVGNGHYVSCHLV